MTKYCWSLLKFMSIESVMLPNHLILCHPLLLLTSVFPSIRVFSNESALCIKWPEYRTFSFSISPTNEYLRLISFRMDWFDLLAVQGTLKSLLQYHSSKASVLWCWTFFMVQLSHPYMIFVSKVWLCGKESACSMQEMQGLRIQSLDQEDPLEKEIASILVFLSMSHGQRSLAGYSPWGHRREMTYWLNDNNDKILRIFTFRWWVFIVLFSLVFFLFENLIRSKIKK